MSTSCSGFCKGQEESEGKSDWETGSRLFLEKDILHIPVDASGSYVIKDFDSAYRNVRLVWYQARFGYFAHRRREIAPVITIRCFMVKTLLSGG